MLAARSGDFLNIQRTDQRHVDDLSSPRVLMDEQYPPVRVKVRVIPGWHEKLATASDLDPEWDERSGIQAFLDFFSRHG